MAQSFSQRNAANLPTWHLTDFAAIGQALEDLALLGGWRGQPTYDPTTSSWRVELNADNPKQQVIAAMGDNYLVLDYVLRYMTADEYAAQGYSPAV